MTESAPGPLPASLPDLEQLQEIRRLATDQQGALRYGQVQRFEALLERRQALIDALAAPAVVGAANVIPFPAAATPEKQRLQALHVLQQIMALDRENEATLRARVNQVRERLGTVRRGRRAQQRYAPLGDQSAGRIERSG